MCYIEVGADSRCTIRDLDAFATHMREQRGRDITTKAAREAVVLLANRPPAHYVLGARAFTIRRSKRRSDFTACHPRTATMRKIDTFDRRHAAVA
jgi:hypothetical protein